MKRSYIFGLAALTLMVPLAAKADSNAGWYMGAGGLATFQSEAHSKVGGATDKILFEPGWGLEGSGGYAWDNGVRMEGELAYRRSAVDKITGTGATSASGSIRNLSLMDNAFYDFHNSTRFTPYVGAGIGGSFVDAQNVATVNTRTLDQNRLAFAYQGIAGVQADIDKHWSITADYRYFRTLAPDFKTNLGDHATTENASHNIMIGVRYSFGAPEQPAPLPPVANVTPPAMSPPKAEQPAVPAVSQNYVVFFDFDKTAITPEAKVILAQVAEAYKKGLATHLAVKGQTDTMGSNTYNKKLSEKRALAVKKTLEKLGVPSDKIATLGTGKTDLAVPTNDQVREAQNRRAEIVIESH